MGFTLWRGGGILNLPLNMEYYELLSASQGLISNIDF